MTDLLTRLREKLKLPDIDLRKKMIDHTLSETHKFAETYFLSAMMKENARLSKVHEALVECVNALNFYADSKNYEPETCSPVRYIRKWNRDQQLHKTYDAGFTAEQALSKLEQLLKEGG